MKGMIILNAHSMPLLGVIRENNENMSWEIFCQEVGPIGVWQSKEEREDRKDE